jgi:hypothetical protein
VGSVLKETMGCEVRDRISALPHPQSSTHQCFLVVTLLQWRDLDLGRDKIKIMDSRGNAEFDSTVAYEDEDFKSFVYIPEKTPLRAPRHQALLRPNGCSLCAVTYLLRTQS